MKKCQEAADISQSRWLDGDESKCGVMTGVPPPAHAPFCQVMAGRGAPEVSQCRMTDVPSITALSAGPAVMFGAIPAQK